jgi:hypothetical protein
MPISITKGINFNSSGSAIINNEIFFNQPSIFNQGTTFNQPSVFNQGTTFNQTSNFNQNAIFNGNITTVSGTSTVIFNAQNKLLIPTVSGTENRLIWIS